jgi:hypothetical protein
MRQQCMLCMSLLVAHEAQAKIPMKAHAREETASSNQLMTRKDI